MAKNQDPTAASLLVLRPGRINIAALLGFSHQPADDQNLAHLIATCDASCFASTLADLPHGGWSSQGMCEAAVEVEANGERPWDSTQWSSRPELAAHLN